MDYIKEKDRIINFIREVYNKENKKGVIIGISGGIDSALTAYLLTEALGKERVFALFLPEMDSDKTSKKDAMLIINTLGLKYKIISMTSVLWNYGIYNMMPLWIIPTNKLKRKIIKFFYDKYTAELGRTPFFALNKDLNKELLYFNEGIAYHRIKHRVRMVYLYLYAEKLDYIVAGCANKTEKLIGFYVRYGDDACDLAPISHLYKSDVWELSKIIGVPQSIISKEPTPDLLPGIVDEYAMNIKYNKLDFLLSQFEDGRKIEEIEFEDEQLKNIIYEQYLWSKEQLIKPYKI